MSMTAQEVFNTVWNHFVVEKNPPSLSASKLSCMYRGPNGTKCAAGLFIVDADYREDLEGLSPFGVKAHGVSFTCGDHLSLLEDLQQAHDDAATQHDFYGLLEEELRGVAWEHKLTPPEAN